MCKVEQGFRGRSQYSDSGRTRRTDAFSRQTAGLVPVRPLSLATAQF